MIIWLIQGFEISLSRMSLFGIVSIQLCPVIILYLSLTRDWSQLALLATAFAYIGSSVASVHPMIFISVYLWTAFIAKALVITLALENRRAFTFLVMTSVVFAKLLYASILRVQGVQIEYGIVLQSILGASFFSSILAFLIYPTLVFWDRYFEHDIDSSRDLNPLM
ncbi:hypothetical protein GW915_05025 [bacterium]|nr:hypothetical protein [bacterium]